MDALKEQIMIRKKALNPDEKKGGKDGDGEDKEALNKKSYLMSKFAEISDDDNDDH